MEQPKKKRSIIPYYFVAFFLTVLVANIILVYIALSSWTGLETKNHYVKGLNYNEALQGAAQQEALGWDSQIRLELSDKSNGAVTVKLTEKDSSPLTGANVTLKVIRPTHHGHDQTLNMAEIAPGNYQVKVTFPLEGNWDLKQIVVKGEDAYQSVTRVFIQDGKVKR